MRRRTVLATTMALAASAATLWSFSSSPLPEPPPLDATWPAASPPAGMAIYQLPTGTTHRSAAFAYRGGSFLDKRDFSMTAVLVRHPRGDVLIDTGFGRDIDAHFALMPAPFRLITGYTKSTPAAAQLDAAGYDRRSLRGVILTHAHWDHVSGLADLADTPVLVNEAERAFIDEGGYLTAVARAAAPRRYDTYTFDGPPYLGFPASHDLHGDGSIVIVPCAGHTPGSVIVFVTLPWGARHAFIGDLAWQREGVSLREERPVVTALLGDHDRGAVQRSLVHMYAVSRRFPDMLLIPAHDARAFEALPRLPGSFR